MKHDDNTLQAAIDAATLEIETGTQHKSLDTYVSNCWHKESPARLALAKAFLAKLPEAKTASVAGLSKTASSTFEAHGKTWNCHTPSDPRPCSGDSIINIYCEGDIKEHAMIRCHASEVVWSCQTIRGWRYADKPDSTDWKAKPAPSTFEAHGKVWNRHIPGDPIPVDTVTRIDVLMDDNAVCLDQYVEFASTWNSVIGWRYADEPDSTDWKAKYERAEAALAESEKQFQAKVAELLETLDRAEKAEAELAAIKSSQIGILRPLAEAGPVPDGCVRVKGYKCAENDWCLAHWENWRNTHFADIRLPSTETPVLANQAADPYARLKAYAKAGARIRVQAASILVGDWKIGTGWKWDGEVSTYEVHPDDLHLVPEYAPVNEQPKQQVPLGPEDVMPGSVFRSNDQPDTSFWTVSQVWEHGFYLRGECVDWHFAMERMEINRSIPLTGKWNPEAWEPCYKLI